MTPVMRFFATREDLSKKNDDSPPTAEYASSHISQWRRGLRRRRHTVFGLLAVVLVYCLVQYLHSESSPGPQPYDPGFEPLQPTALDSQRQVRPPTSPSDVNEHYYNGPIKLYSLSAALQEGIDVKDNERNVLFVLSNLKSAANVFPLACEMAAQKRNKVHIGLVGRQDIAIEVIRQIYAIDKTDCPVYWEDGRPDFAPYSSDFRMQWSVKSALGHMQAYLRPQAVIVNSAEQEDVFFSVAVKEKLRDTLTPLISLPEHGGDSLAWLARLDSSAIRQWNEVQIDMLVHASATASGSLIRLLRSIENADYFGTTPPRLIIELPATVDEPTTQFLSSFRWPPKSSASESQVIVRRRMNPRHEGPADASLRVVEAFYPNHAPNSHVLVLSADAELSPAYYHYLMYTLLEYKHSSFSHLTSSHLLGISLEQPRRYLNASVGFAPPSVLDSKPSESIFLWQAPSSNAALYFGDKWVEFHSFLSHRLAQNPNAMQDTSPEGVVSHLYPSWMGYMLELCRARGYAMLYPSFVNPGSTSLVTVHEELFQPPAEFADTTSTLLDERGKLKTLPKLNRNTFLTAEDQRKVSEDDISVRTNIESILVLLPKQDAQKAVGPHGGRLPHITSLLVLSHDGFQLSPSALGRSSDAYAAHFSLAFGGCRVNGQRPAFSASKADDLFCYATGTVPEHSRATHV